MPPRFPFFHFINNSLRAKITLGVVLPLVILLVIFATIENARQQDIVLRHLSASASRSVEVMENSLRHAMLESDFSEVQSALDSINDMEDFRVIYLLDASGKIIFTPDQVGIGIQLKNTEPGCQPCHSLELGTRPGSVIVTAENGQRVFRSMYPIKNSPECSKCHDRTQRIIGLLLTDIPVDPVEQALRRESRENLYWWAGMILLTALIVNFSMNSLVVKRLENLAQALQDFGQGHHDIRLKDEGSDELGQLAESFNEMGQKIKDDETEKQKLSDQLGNQNLLRAELLKRLITAQEDERKRLARELHDDLGQALSALSLQVQTLERLFGINPDEATKQLNQIGDLITEAAERMYDLIFALRPSVLDEFGLAAAVRNHVEKFFDGSGIAFTMDFGGYSGRLPPDVETALYRVFQEALSNVRRHAQASHVKITLELKDGIFTGEIKDDGVGFNPSAIRRGLNDQSGLGMLSIKERIAQWNGQVEFLSQAGTGTTVIIRLPITETESD